MKDRLYTDCANLFNAAAEMRLDCLEMALAAGDSGAHLGGAFSSIEILAALYLQVMNDPASPESEARDRFIMSKGHGVPAQYAAMKQVGLIAQEELATFKHNGSFLSGHPSMEPSRGIEFSSGSLGQGLSLGVGVSIALKRRGNLESRAFVLLGDGECDEGSIWEAAMSAAHYQLNNLVAIIDRNDLQYDGATASVLSLGNLKQKWESFGWVVTEIDGHNFTEILSALAERSSISPRAIIANTVKGKGVSFMENNRAWHHSRLTQELYDQARSELVATIVEK